MNRQIHALLINPFSFTLLFLVLRWIRGKRRSGSTVTAFLFRLKASLAARSGPMAAPSLAGRTGSNTAPPPDTDATHTSSLCNSASSASVVSNLCCAGRQHRFGFRNVGDPCWLHRWDTFFFRSVLFTEVSCIERINSNLVLLFQLLAVLSTRHDKLRTVEHTEYQRFYTAKLLIAVAAGTLGQHHTTLMG
jgi:hypothetical protein